MSIQENCRVVANTRLGEGLYALTMHAPAICAQAQCGQFVHIACGEGNLLRRPISICGWQGDALRVVFQTKGEGTKWLAARQAGDVLDVLGPLGHGFGVAALGAKPVLIGGGIGVPPMLELAQALSRVLLVEEVKAGRADGSGDSRQEGRDVRVTAVLGYRDSQLFLKEEFEPWAEVYVSTDDGSAGTKGTVIDAVRENGVEADVIFACGPKPMLRAVKAYAAEKGIPCYVSLEERMACGIGACLGCVCKTTGEDTHSHVHNARVCKDGPVFAAEEVEL